MKVIGITGTNGAGKGTVVELLQKRFPNIIHRSTRDIIKNIATSEGVEIRTREDLTNFANDYNAIRGNSFFKTFIIENLDKEEIYILESVRRIHEIKSMRELLSDNIIILGVDADIKVRHERISRGRGDSLTDNVSFEDFVRQEGMEQNTDDEKKQNLNGCMKFADFTIDNGGSFEDLEMQIKKLIEKYPNFFPQQ